MTLRRTTVGLVTEWLDSGYHHAIVKGARDAALGQHVSFVCFRGKPAARLLREGTMDAAIVLSRDLVVSESDEDQGLSERLRRMPLCSISKELPGASCVSVDNEGGVRAAVTHLAQAHGQRRIGFVCGIAGNVDADRRLEAYRDAMSEVGLEVDQHLILPGAFTGESGQRAATLLLDERRVSHSRFQGFLFANDAMALGFASELERRGIRVPQELTLIGFDDNRDAHHARVPLTTVRQPLDAVGRQAMQHALTLLRTHQPTHTTLSTELVLRRSCGCVVESERGDWTPARAREMSFSSALMDRRPMMMAEILRAAEGHFGMLGSGWEGHLVSACADDVRGRTTDAFRDVLEDMLRRIVRADGPVREFNRVISVFYRYLPACAANDHELRARGERLLDDARLAIAGAAARVEAAWHVETENWATRLASALAALAGCHDLESLGEVFESHLLGLGISSAHILRAGGGRLDGTFTRVLRFQDGKSRADSTNLREAEIVAALESHERLEALMVSDLSVDEQFMGYVSLELRAPHPMVYESLCSALSGVLRHMWRD